MVRIARERVSALFALAEREAAGGRGELANRYVVLARKIGTRYNVRLLPEYRELYCRGCSVFWVEGRSVRTRLRSGRRVRTCLACGRERRTPLGTRTRGVSAPVELESRRVLREEGAPVEIALGEESEEPTDDESEVE
ncbi:MAG: ribonuclease P protein component 4 [Thermoplasmata archaeon]